jgi:hypothetical protein
MAADRNAELKIMSASIAAGIVRVDSEMYKNLDKVAEISVDLADKLIERIESGASDETSADDEAGTT